jgi:hypothetical protein
MLEFAEDSSPEGRRKLLDSLTAKQRQLEAHAQTQSQEVLSTLRTPIPLLMPSSR